MQMILPRLLLALFACLLPVATANAGTPTWPAALPVFDHIVVVIEENKDYSQIIGNGIRDDTIVTDIFQPIK